MAVSNAYLKTMQRAARIKTDTAELTAMLTDLINEARAELIRLGVLPIKANDETDDLVRGAVRSYVLWHMAPDAVEGAANQENFEKQLDALRRTGAYTEAVEA